MIVVRPISPALQARIDSLPGRAEKSRAAAEWLFLEAGEYPSAKRVREITRLGSTGDIARDLKGFWDDIRLRLKMRVGSSDLPEGVLTSATAFIDNLWRIAVEQAQATAPMAPEENDGKPSGACRNSSTAQIPCDPEKR